MQAEGFRELGAEEDIWPEMEEVTGEWRRLHSEELYALDSLLNVIWVYQIKNEIRQGMQRVWKTTWKTQAQMGG